MIGTVYLVGAGAGDAKLLTLRGAELLQQADCVIYDRLGTEQLLEQIPPHCEKIYVGKADSHHTLSQQEINCLLEQKAKEHPIVVRLKGGDPFVFGRGGEEGCYLKEKNIPFQVVSGVTSAIAGLAAAGIPITHRELARGFRVYTAHDKDGGFGGMDFASMANTNDTLVFLMGLGRVEQIAAQLMKYGKSSDTPCAVISNASLPTQKSVFAPLQQLAAKVKQEQLHSPALIVVGEVVQLSEQLNWFEQRPLFGKKILFPQTGTDSRLEKMLQEQGAEVQRVQVSSLQPLEQAWENICKGAGAEWVAFTSHNGVQFFFDAVAKNRQDSRCLAGTMVAAIGESTAQALQQYGIRADFVATGSTSEQFAEELSQEMMAGERLVVVCPNQPLSPCWAMENNSVIAAPVYENVPNPDAQIPDQSPNGAVFTCASSVHRFAALLKNQTLKKYLSGIPVAAIGAKTAEALQQYEIFPAICSESNYTQLVKTLCQLFKDKR